jgi:hypothetical protein
VSAALRVGAAPMSPNRKARRAARRAPRRPVASPEIAQLKRLEPDAYLDLTLKEAFALERDRLSSGGTNESWMRSSNPGFTGTEDLGCSFFGPDRRIRDITKADCDDFVRALGAVTNKWGRKPTLRCLPMSELIDWTDDQEERRLLEIERRAELEGWSDEEFVAAVAKAREPRLTPANQYKHQGYFASVLKTVYRLAKAIDDQPMREAIWKKSYLKKLMAEAGEKRVALGPEGRARLFSRPIFADGPAASDDPLFWQPLITRYAGLRMEEGCQLKPEDIGVEDGVPVIRIRAGADQRLKSAHSQRLIPIHPELIRLGLIRLAAEKRRLGSRWLFGVERGLDGTFSSRFSKIYYNWRCAQGIYEQGKDFHSLRKDFYQSLRSAKVDYAARIRLMGHALNDVSETHYGQDWDIAEMQEFIARIASDTTHIRPAA